MGRFTTSAAEIQHIAKMHKQIPVWGIVVFELQNGQKIEGLVMRSNLGTDAGSGGNPWPTSYHAELTVQSIDGQAWLIDYLDVKSASDVTAQRMTEFQNAGLVSVVDLSDEKK